MNIIIIGCGKVGSTIAKSLFSEKHNITVIDKDEAKVNNVTTNVDCMGIVGSGAIQSVLLEAKVDTCDFLIACTNSDEINILTCLMARKCSECRTIARIRNPEYSSQIDYIMNELDISMTINPELATANEISRIIRYSSSLSSDSFFKGRLNLLRVEVPDESNVIGCKLFEISKKFNCNVLVCVIERNGEVFVPSGYDTLEKGDKICFVSDHANAIQFFNVLGYKYKPLKSFIIVGASKIARYLINNLIKNNSDCNIKLIDIDKKVCDEFASEYTNISVVCADAADKNMLIKEGLNDVDAFITLTGIDEENIILSLLAKHNKNAKVITKINHLNFIDSLNELDVGSIVNPERVAANLVVSNIRASSNSKGTNVSGLYRIYDEKVEALSFKIKAESNITNIELRNLKIKKNIIIAGIYRKGEVIIPNGYDMIKVKDSVVVISKDQKLNDLTDILV